MRERHIVCRCPWVNLSKPNYNARLSLTTPSFSIKTSIGSVTKSRGLSLKLVLNAEIAGFIPKELPRTRF